MADNRYESKYKELGYIRNPNISTQSVTPYAFDQSPLEKISIDHNINYQEDASVEWSGANPRGSLGTIYSYGYTMERAFPLNLIITDYVGDGKSIKNVKQLLRKWMQPKVAGQDIIAPPPVLEFYYEGLTDTVVKVILQNYTINHQDDMAWNVDTQTPFTLDIDLQLLEVGVTYRNQ